MKEFNLDIPKIGDLMLVKHQKGFYGNQIKKFQMKQGYSEQDASWVHVDLLLGGPYSVRIQPPRNIVLGEGKNLTMPEFYKGKTVRILRFDMPDWNERRYRIAIWYACKANLKYDKLGILRFYLPFLVDHSESLYFCSEGALNSLRHEYKGLSPVNRSEKDECDIIPADFTLTDWSYKDGLNKFCNLKTVWEGELL